MSFVTVCELDELSEDIPLAVDLDDLELAIIFHQGEYFAIHNECSHGHVELSDGDVEDCAVECYLHGSRFDLRTGKALNLPATEPVPVYPVKIDGNEVLVDIANPTQPESNQE